MIRYEIHSNVASSDHGLQRFPALEDLTHTLKVKNIEARFVKQVFREEEEINLASSRHAKGVKVRSTSVREIPVESHIKGALRWMRSVAARADRGLHLEIEKIRATNGAALVFGQIFARKQKVFISGLDEDGWTRMVAKPDLSCQTIPEPIARSEALRKEYMGRSTRPTGFMATLARISELGLAGGDTLPLLREIIAKRDTSLLKNMSEAQVINLGLIYEYLERYEKLIDQFCTLLFSESVLGDLGPMWDLFTQGIPYDLLHRSFAEFALEEKRGAIRDKRSLVHELRIGLGRGEDEQRAAFVKRFTPLMIKGRMAQDPKLYGHAIRLKGMEPEVLEAMSSPRKLFIQWVSDGAVKEFPKEIEPYPVPQRMKQGMFELAVSLVFQGKYSTTFREGNLPTPVKVARNLLSCFVLEKFNISTIRNLHPNLPVRGVAKNLAGKVPITFGELNRIHQVLGDTLFPMGRLAEDLSSFILARYQEQEDQTKAKELQAYLKGANSQLLAMNYVLGRAGQTPLLRRAVLAAGEALGLVMLDSRDRIRGGEAADQNRGEEAKIIAGYQLLMVEDDSNYFPLHAQPAHLAGAYSLLFHERISHLTRRFVSKKLKYLFDLHGGGFFQVIYDQLMWGNRLSFSPGQLAGILLKGGVFDRARIKNFGFGFENPGPEKNKKENPWLLAALEDPSGEGASLFSTEHAREEIKAAEAEFQGIVKSYGNSREGNGTPTLQGALASLAGQEIFDLRSEPSRDALRGTKEAGELTQILEGIVRDRETTLLSDQETNEAVEFFLPGPLAFLQLLKESHEFEINGQPLLVRLRPAFYLKNGQLDEESLAAAGQLKGLMGSGAPGGSLRAALETLQRHDQAWGRLTQAAVLPLVDQMIMEIILRRAKPTPPLPRHLSSLKEDRILCLSTSSYDQAKFSRIVAHPERRDIYATLSELASWLMRFRRLNEEMEFFREVIADVLEIIAGLNLSAFDAPYINRYVQMLKELFRSLSIRPEEITPEDLDSIERQSRIISRLVRESYDQERSVAMRDRWLSRIAMRLRSMHPNLRLTFVDLLFEHIHPSLRSREREKDQEAEEQKGAAKVEEYQTFSERMRNVTEIRERLEGKDVFVMSPSNTQRQLTLMLIEQLYRLKGVHTAIFADISGCASFVDHLRSRLPPYRIFNLNDL